MAFVSLTYPNGVEVFINRDKRVRPVQSISHPSYDTHFLTDRQPRPPKPVPQYRRSNDIKSDFIECVKTRERPFRDVEIAVNTMTALHMIEIARRLGRSLNWDRATQSFANDGEANRLLDRARREPWQL